MLKEKERGGRHIMRGEHRNNIIEVLQKLATTGIPPPPSLSINGNIRLYFILLIDVTERAIAMEMPMPYLQPQRK